MFKKVVFISTILFICLISISFVCAIDNTTDEKSILAIEDSSDAEIIEDAPDGEIVSDAEVGNFTELSGLISDADATLDLDKNYARLSGDDVSNTGIVINKSITINGNGHAIDADALGRIFSVSGSDVVLKNITFINGKISGYGGAIYSSGTNFTLENCKFVDNYANYGGAVYSTGLNAKVIDCEFSNSSAYYNGGAIRSTGNNLTVEGSKFNNNHAIDYGGAIYSSGSYNNIKNSTFVNSTADDSAAIYYQSDYSTIVDSKFYNNSAKAYDGGAIGWYGDYGNLTDSVFENNSANNHGGGVFWHFNYGNMKNLTFINNSAANGAGLFVMSKNYSDDNSYSYNVITNSTFINNTALYGAGGADISSHGKIANSTFINNTAGSYGGALGLTNAEADNCELINSSAVFGGAVYTYNSTIKDSTFDGNSATDGNSIYILDKAVLDGNKNLRDEDIYLYESGKERGYIVDNNYNIDDLITTTEDYFAYCAERYNTNPYQGVFDNRMVLLKNSINGQPVAEYLKILIYEYLDGTQDLKNYDFEDYVWTFTDYEYWNSEDPIIKEVIRLYDSGYRVPTENACKVLSNGSLMYFNFSSLITPTGQQNLFLFKFDYGDLINETFTKEALNETVLVYQTVDFRIVISNKGQSVMYDLFVEDNDYSDGLKYESWRSEIGDWSYDDVNKKWKLDELLPAKSASFIVTFRANANGTLYNNATGGVGRKEINKSSARVTVYKPDISVEKISLNPVVEIGNKTIFKIIVRNTGDMELSDVFVIEDEYSDGLVFLGFESINGEWKHSLSEDSKHVFALSGQLGVGESRSFLVIFNATKEGALMNTVLAGYGNNTLSNSTNVTDVTHEDVEKNNTNETNKTQNKTLTSEGIKANVLKTVHDDKATGNPLFALLLTLMAIPIAKRFEK